MTTHSGSCHCGRLRFTVEADIDTVIDCNCSMCARRGGLLFFVPEAQVQLQSPVADPATYAFNQKRIRHHFCPVCGIAPFSRGTDPNGHAMYAVNARCVDGLDLSALKIRKVDGRSF